MQMADSNETHVQTRAHEQVVTTLRVEVVDGPDRGKHAVSTEALAIGTAKDNALPHADFTVSRNHHEIRGAGGGNNEA